MNDIEVLEEFKKNGYHMLLMKCGDRHTTNLKLEMAIENLLKERQSDKDRIKDLEEINEAHKKENGELREREKDLQKSVDQIYEDYQDIGKMYFNLTEKIESKIEELKQEDLKIYDTDSEDVRIAKYEQRAVLQVLEELLKGE